ncbi:hypothetical protein C8Q76DRAFT_796652 [Earliella scabrosa]|nr:hypothetical protein C8Q76DRAFT_796652 [Earliella scabrosa]
MVGYPSPLSPDDILPEVGHYYVVLGGDRQGIYGVRPPGVAVGRHIDLLPIVIVSKWLSQARLIDRLNTEVMLQLVQSDPEEPAELLQLLQSSRIVARAFPLTNKFYCVRVGKLTGIFVGIDWTKEILPLTSFERAEFQSFKTLIEALVYMLDKKHLRPQLSDDSEDLWQYFDEDDSSPPPPPPSVTDLPPPPPPSRASASTPLRSSPKEPRAEQHVRFPSTPSRNSSSRAATPVATPHRPSSPSKIAISTPRSTSPSKEVRTSASFPTKAEYVLRTLERSTSLPPPYLSPSQYAKVGSSRAAVFAESASTCGARRGYPAGQGSGIAQLSHTMAAVRVSDSEAALEAAVLATPTVDGLRTIIYPPTGTPDGCLVVDAPVVNLGVAVDHWCNGRRMPHVQRCLVFQTYVWSDSMEEFGQRLSCPPVNLTMRDGRLLWDFITAHLPPRRQEEA